LSFVMAYPQHPAQRPPPMRNYGPRPSRPAGPPQDGHFDQGYDYGYPSGNGGYDDVGYGYPGDQAVPRSYGPPRGAPRPPRGGYGPPMDSRPDRGYAPRGRPPPNQYDAPRGYGDRRAPSRQDRSRPPPRPMPPPSNAAWDNPFPIFPSQEPRSRSGSTSTGIETGMARMDLNGPMSPVTVPDRPHTSHARRQEMPRQPPPGSAGRGRGDYPAGPVRSTSQGRPPAGRSDWSERSERSYTDPDGPPPIPQINRSATVPVPAAPPMTPAAPPVAKPMYPGQATYQDPTFTAKANAHKSLHVDALLDSYYSTAHADEPEMPNFDAMPDGGHGGPIDESLLGLEKPKSKTPAPPAPQGQYAAFQPQPTDVHHVQSQPEIRSGAVPNQFENAGFHFDLPASAPAAQHQEGMDYGFGYEDPMQTPHQQHHGSWGSQMNAYSDEQTGYASRGGSIRSNGPQPYRANQPAYANEAPPPVVNQMDPADPEQNPDALPHHPAPFRPGHDQGSGPAPVRQYNSAADSAPPPVAAQQGPPVDSPAGPVTQEELQQLQRVVKSNPSDKKTQLLLAQKLAEASVVLVESSRLDPKSKAKAREKYSMDAYKIVKKLVSSGYADAQFFLADCYGQGLLGLQVDHKEAFHLYQTAAKQGHGQSAYRTAVCCEIGAEEGGGTKRDPFKAVHWYKRAASLGDPPAMYKMGMIMLKGLLGQAKNPREGVSWLKRAAERADAENPHALHELALMYANAGPNDIVIRDEAYASQLFHQAAELGYKFSQFQLATAYEYGLMGCPVDPRQSIFWYTHAAAQGEHQSELALSGWYLTGAEGILQQSDTEAYLWARKAATSSLAKAEYAMGYYTEVGIGVTANMEDAKRWYWRAAAQGFPKARERLEEIKKGGAQMQKARLSRSGANQQKQNEGDCILM
ncbi:chitin synthase activator (Chs3), partial [Aspergillus nomiae NRRL 13137]